VQEIPEKALVVAPAGFGVGLIDHAVPFHASASVSFTPELLTYSPTATQAVAAVHVTPERALLVAPVGVGVDWIDQVAARADEAPARHNASVARAIAHAPGTRQTNRSTNDSRRRTPVTTCRGRASRARRCQITLKNRNPSDARVVNTHLASDRG
jgi:hypothetical protein